ncbi:glycosyltransferase family 2 protein [Granulicella arctica]|uniref:Glycosyltransferase involved in cell wall biosynthesis n=1 Tax=Granulicella arctica TaxID=940613 RepID=A0A7Y9PJ20_9BACT|nr:glycosyltransferase family 2 protein [Granulicella arctica]NYF80812.1 glycosyltransferase involved in cell wall biosynthesis [Granulicella arctica]
MSTIRFSLVTPTFNRASTLKRMLQHLHTVDGINGCEVIIINDGSTDGTDEVLADYLQAMPKLLRVITLSNGGPARARNTGVEAAKNERILFIDDDVFPHPDMLYQHWNMLDNGYDGSQGILLWHQEIAVTPLIRYIDSRGSQFAFEQIEHPEDLGSEHIYTGNFAVRRDAVLQAGGFCERLFDHELAFSAFEDTMLGCSMKKKGARLGLNRKAVADHLHHMSETGYLRREYNVGSGVAQLEKLFPEITQHLGLKPRGSFISLQVGLLRIVNALPGLRHVIGYQASMRMRHRASFLRGYRRYEKEYSMGKERPTA